MSKTPAFIQVEGHLYKRAFDVPSAAPEGPGRKVELIESIVVALQHVYDAKGDLHEAVGALERSEVFDSDMTRALINDLDESLSSLPEADNLKWSKEVLERLKGPQSL